MVLADLAMTRVTSAEFDVWVQSPENQHRHFELFDGEIIEKMVSGPEASRLSLVLLIRLGAYVYANNLGEMTGADGGYQIGDNRFIPDGAFLSHDKWQAPVVGGYRAVAPDLVIESISPTDRTSEVINKVNAYVRAGTTVWLADERYQSVTVYAPNSNPKTYEKNQTLEGGALLPDFKLDLVLVFGA
jgi:Uma2 family endonuclease